MGRPLDLFAAASPEGAWSVSQVTRRARAVVNRRLPAPPSEGVQVFAFGQPTVWDEKGEFRLTVYELLSTEEGGLWKLAFEKAKAALARDGLLEPGRKRALPRFPRRIAVITSPDGAALKDIIAVVGRRWPVAELIVLPAQVQGDGAEAELCAALAALRRLAVDVAPTPSAAAEAATPDRADVRAALERVGERLARGLTTRAQRAGDLLARSQDRLVGALERRLERLGDRLAAHGAHLDALSPLKILGRGYAVARDVRGDVLRRVAQFAPGLAFRLRVSDGEVPARAEPS